MGMSQSTTNTQSTTPPPPSSAAGPSDTGRNAPSASPPPAQLDPDDLPDLGGPPNPFGATVLHPPPPQRRVGPPMINNPRSNLAQALSYFIPISTPDMIHSHPSDADNHPPPHIRLVSLYLTRAGLPAELLPRVLDYAEYWSVCTRLSKRSVSVHAGSRSPRVIRNGNNPPWTSGQEDDLLDIIDMEESGLQDEDGKVWYLVSEPIGCAEMVDQEKRRQHALVSGGVVQEEKAEGEEQDEGEGKEKVFVRQISVSTLSKDQGWSSSNPQAYGTYDQSYTWFDLTLLRDGKEVEDSRLDFQHNVHAGQYYKEHKHTFDVDHKLVKMAQPGDRVVLWARAQYPGWINNVREATISIHTSSYPTQSL